MEKLHFCAEIGSNHAASLPLALQLIKEAAQAGATSVKFQYFRGETLTSSPTGRQELRQWELPDEWLPHLRTEAMKEGLQLGYSVFAPSDMEKIAKWVDWLKISAYDLTYHQLIRAAVATGKPIILSTAMATWEEIVAATSLIPPAQRLALLHGTACYPTKPEDANLRAISLLLGMDDWNNDGWAKYRWQQVGLSDHTLGWLAPVIAISLGATWIEKHFKGSSLLQTPDWPHSADCYDLAALIQRGEQAQLLLGKGKKAGPLPCELPLFQTARRTNEQPLRKGNL